jgi:hypothetical protein
MFFCISPRSAGSFSASSACGIGWLLACHPVEFRSGLGKKQMRDVSNAIEPRPEWSDAQELEQAQKLGLHYGPEDRSVDRSLRGGPKDIDDHARAQALLSLLTDS